MIRSHNSLVDKGTDSDGLHIQEPCTATSLPRDHFAQPAKQLPVCPFLLQWKPRLYSSIGLELCHEVQPRVWSKLSPSSDLGHRLEQGCVLLLLRCKLDFFHVPYPHSKALVQKFWRPQHCKAAKRAKKQRSCSWCRSFGWPYPIRAQLWGFQATGHGCRQVPQQSFLSALLFPAFLQLRKPIAELVLITALCHYRKKVTDRCELVYFDVVFYIPLRNTGSCIPRELTVFEQLVDVMQLITFEASDKRLLWKKGEWSPFSQGSQVGQKTFPSWVSAQLRSKSLGLFR